MEHVFLTRRNLEVLLSKLDRVKAGESSACTLVKYKNPHGEFTQTMKEISVTAVEDAVYYVDRHPGEVHPSDIPTSETQTTNDIP